ncbi:thioester reductase domain-containing protein [Acaryochloris sp. IP29b_bin.137]|uniref:thioester reductase domain-containing protein n=1 Tax=Acaryochloris sp. IP29b_bin.137 TaxID=2969217 RepID=UPI0026186516|nr:thioester reductase domain-containing protein [Acaryochloris sp. IP29b_bin.137]
MSAYLKPSVIAEPLINQWYAWSYLIPPATAARYLTESQLRIMQSFVDAPAVHAATLRNPAMQGGPFIQHAPNRVGEIKALLEKTKVEQTRLVGLSKAIATLTGQLANHSPGESLEPLYADLPDALKGYVELAYDAQNNPSIRWIEGLLYRSEYYSPAQQSLALHLDADCDQRAFVMSTPRLPDDNSLFLSIPFADGRLDQLFQMRHQPQSVQAIAALLEIRNCDRTLFEQLFTSEPPRQRSPYLGSGVRVRYMGHACVLIETAEVSILCDPLISYEHPTGMARYSYSDLPETIDYALITHNHQDHVMLETLLQLRHKIKHLIVPSGQKGSLLDPSLKLALQQIGFSQVSTLDELDSIPLPDGEIISIPVLGEHGDLNIATKNAYWITLKGRSILCAADSNNLDSTLYAHIHHLLGDLDLLFIGMECDGAPFTWAYGPLLLQPTAYQQAQTRRLDGSNCDRALDLINQLNPQQVYVYAMGQEPWLTYITSIDYTPDSAPIQESSQLVEHCQQQNRISERLLGHKEIELPPGQPPCRTSAPISVKPVITPVPEFVPRLPKQQKPVSQQPLTSISPATPMPNDDLTPFLTQLQSLDIRLWLEEDTLRCSAPKGALTPELTAQLKEHKPTIIALLKGSTVQASGSSVDQSSAQQPDWQQDRILPADITPSAAVARVSSSPKTIFLTGATGFLGAFLLFELLQQTDAQIHCLVRDLNLDKFKQCLSDYQIWNPSFAARLVPVVGDLSQPYLGLSETQFSTLAEQVDSIYHNGAQVHHISPYTQLKATNVDGTREIIRLACHGHPKPLHYTSTLSVLPPTPLTGQAKIYEQDDLSAYPVPTGGYNRSKWVAEQLVAQARDRHLPVTIYRPGPISGHSQTGVFNRNDFLYRLMQGYVQSGMAPDGEMPLDILPVDYVSKIMVYLSLQQTSIGKAFHLIHPQPTSSDLIFSACHGVGYPIERVPYATWFQKLMEIAQGDRTHALYPLVSLFASRQETATTSKSRQLELPFDTQQTDTALEAAPFKPPTLNQVLFETYLNTMIETGTLSPPPVPA